MTIKFSRAQRRADYARIKANRQYHWGYGHKQNWRNDREIDNRGQIESMSDRSAGIVTTTAKPCSCWMCGNPRRGACSDFGMLTKQEVQALHDANDQLNEYHIDASGYFHDEHWWDHADECYWCDEDHEWEYWQYRIYEKLIRKYLFE